MLTTLLLGACTADSPVKPRPAPPSQQAAVVPATPVAAELERIFPPPAMLDGLDAAKVLDLLGRPSFKRQDDPALIWQYRTPQCALDLFLYRDRKGGPYRVQHFETRNRGHEAVSAKDCFSALITANEKGSSG